MNTYDQILMLLKTRGPQTAQSLAGLMGLTAMGVRRQLEAAVEDGLVRFRTAPARSGGRCGAGCCPTAAMRASPTAMPN
jgi:predicted ArsR family transcriptional regulator